MLATRSARALASVVVSIEPYYLGSMKFPLTYHAELKDFCWAVGRTRAQFVTRPQLPTLPLLREFAALTPRSH